MEAGCLGRAKLTCETCGRWAPQRAASGKVAAKTAGTTTVNVSDAAAVLAVLAGGTGHWANGATSAPYSVLRKLAASQPGSGRQGRRLWGTGGTNDTCD